MALILASASPRRRDLLAACGIPYRDHSLHDRRTSSPDEPAAAYVQRLALAKAEAVARHHPRQVVLGADTTVTIDGSLLGKPADEHEARWMLTRLSGRTHDVVTGVAVVCVDTPGEPRSQGASTVVVSHVLMRRFAEVTIDWYLATGEPVDKAGAYAAQGLGSAMVERIEGSYTNVVGLPLTETLALLRQFGITVP